MIKCYTRMVLMLVGVCYPQSLCFLVRLLRRCHTLVVETGDGGLATAVQINRPGSLTLDSYSN